jgi:5-methylcytosine-specific restriction endonuclease McrA
MTLTVCPLWWCTETSPRRLGRCHRHRGSGHPSHRYKSASYWLTHDDPNWRATRLAVLERDGHICQYCGGVGDTVDHIIPASAGGTNDPSNLCACCLADNVKKADHN